VVMCFYLT